MSRAAPYIALGLDDQGRRATGTRSMPAPRPDDEFGDEYDAPMDLCGLLLAVVAVAVSWLAVLGMAQLIGA